MDIKQNIDVETILEQLGISRAKINEWKNEYLNQENKLEEAS